MKAMYPFKSLLLVLLMTFGILGCEKEEPTAPEEELTAVSYKWRKKKKRIKICYANRYGHCRVLRIRKGAWKWFKRRGAVRLDDQDGDGFVTDNACGYGQMGDCDDKDPSVNPDVPGSCGDDFDSDGDGLIGSEDKCPDESGLQELKGCPDADGDGIADKDDECPNEAGPADNNGCPSKELSDYEVLRLLYEANPDNTLSWDLNDASMESWSGVQLNDAGEVMVLEFTPSTPSNVSIIPKEIGMLKELEILLLPQLDLETIPIEIGDLTNLRWLNLFGNKLNDVPKEIGQLTELRVLDLGANGLSELPPEIGNLLNLEELNLFANTFLSELPEDIGRLMKLKKLSIGQASLISVFPTGIQNFKNLEELTFFNTRIEEIPVWIGGFSNLRVLDLGSNRNLTSIPQELANLSELERLYLTNIPLTTIPQAICDLADTDTEILLDVDDVCQ